MNLKKDFADIQILISRDLPHLSSIFRKGPEHHSECKNILSPVNLTASHSRGVLSYSDRSRKKNFQFYTQIGIMELKQQWWCRRKFVNCGETFGATC